MMDGGGGGECHEGSAYVYLHVSVIKGVVSFLEEQFIPKVKAEFSVLVDVLHSPELLFPEAAQLRCDGGAFMSK